MTKTPSSPRRRGSRALETGRRSVPAQGALDSRLRGNDGDARSVIPAQPGTQGALDSRLRRNDGDARSVIPAQAGTQGALDSRLRGNDVARLR